MPRVQSLRLCFFGFRSEFINFTKIEADALDARYVQILDIITKNSNCNSFHRSTVLNSQNFRVKRKVGQR